MEKVKKVKKKKAKNYILKKNSKNVETEKCSFDNSHNQHTGQRHVPQLCGDVCAAVFSRLLWYTAVRDFALCQE